MPETWLDSTSRRLGAAHTMLTLAIGLGLLRGWLGWTLGALRDFAGMPLFLGINGKLWFDIGEILGCAVGLILLARLTYLAERRSPLYVSTGLALVGTATLVIVAGSSWMDPIAVFVLELLSGVGYSIGFLLWIERFGLYTPLQTLIGGAGSYIVSTLIWFYTQPMSATLGGVTAVLCVVFSIAIYLGSHNAPGATLGTIVEGTRANARRYWKIFAWTWLFALTYGIGASLTSMSYSTLVAKVGAVIPLLLLVVFYMANRDVFGFSVAYRVSLAVMVAGFLIAMLFPGNPGIMQICFSASQSLVMTFAITFICGVSRLGRFSAARLNCILALGWYLVAIPGRYVTQALLAALETTPLQEFYAASVAVVALLVGALLLFREVDFLTYWEEICSPAEDGAAARAHACETLAGRASLTERESSVLALLAQELGPAEISEQLFIAPGTVRAHINHIYNKLDVHSKEELRELIEATGAER